MNIQTPYLLFIGDATDPLSIKMAKSVADWRPEICVGEYQLPGCRVSTGMPSMSIAQAAQNGAKSLVLGFANSGGFLDPAWIPTVLEALDAGMDIVSGLHEKLTTIEPIVNKAKQTGGQLIDIRHPTQRFKTGKGFKRTGKRLLTVGTDCSVGKMYTSLSISKGLAERGVDCTFRATGQSGILVAGEGVAIDCVVADFIAGAVEQLAPENHPEHWDIIEGQGSLSHPAFAGVSLGLLHGAQPDAIVICHALQREHMRGIPGRPFPTIQTTIELNEMMAKTTNPEAKVVAISVNTSAVDEQQAVEFCQKTSKEFGVPCVDPVRMGVEQILDALL